MKQYPKIVKRATIILLVLGFIIVGSYFTLFYGGNIIHHREIKIARDFLIETITEDEPSESWIQQCGKEDPIGTFYYFKVWFEEARVSASQFGKAYTAFPVHNDEDFMIFSLRYGKYMPAISCGIDKRNTVEKVSPSFVLNNCLFHADYNRDEIIDAQDVIALRAIRTKNANQPSEVVRQVRN